MSTLQQPATSTAKQTLDSCWLGCEGNVCGTKPDVGSHTCCIRIAGAEYTNLTQTNHKLQATGGTADLQQKDVFSSIAAMDGELAGALLAGDDMQLGGKGSNGYYRLP